MNVLDFKKDMGLWHGVLTVGVFAFNALFVPCSIKKIPLTKILEAQYIKLKTKGKFDQFCGLAIKIQTSQHNF